jgi:hypothetical protein
MLRTDQCGAMLARLRCECFDPDHLCPPCSLPLPLPASYLRYCGQLSSLLVVGYLPERACPRAQPEQPLYTSLMMASVTLDNHLEDYTHSLEKTQLRGFRSKQNILNFLNIPYAKATVRFMPAAPMTLQNLPSPYNATKYGPRCPQAAGTLHLAMKHLFEKVSLVEQLSEETTCLNLNIYTPPGALSDASSPSLPVFVWIHGGAFNTGDNTVQFGKAFSASRSELLTLHRW